MRFISHISKFAVGIVQPVKEILPGNVERIIVPQLTAKFKRGDLHAHEVELAARTWPRLPGQTVEVDQVTQTSPLARLSVYDSEAPMEIQAFIEMDRHMIEGNLFVPGGRSLWAEGDAKRLTEQALLERANGENFIAIAPPVITAPWPNYDSFPGSVDDLVEVLLEQGHNVNQALAYERQNAQRPEVLDSLERLVAEQAAAAHAPVEEFTRA